MKTSMDGVRDGRGNFGKSKKKQQKINTRNSLEHLNFSLNPANYFCFHSRFRFFPLIHTLN